MRVIAYDIYQNPDLDFVEYVDLDTLLAESDLISLHCPLPDDSLSYDKFRNNKQDERHVSSCKHIKRCIN